MKLTQSDVNTISYLSEQYGMFLTVSDIMTILRVSRPVVDNLILTGELPCAKAGKQYRIDINSFWRWWSCRVEQEQKNILKRCLPR